MCFLRASASDGPLWEWASAYMQYRSESIFSRFAETGSIAEPPQPERVTTQRIASGKSRRNGDRLPASIREGKPSCRGCRHGKTNSELESAIITYAAQAKYAKPRSV